MVSDEASDDFREPHLRRGDFLGAFAVLRRDDRILLVRNERVIDGQATTTWDLPGGQVEPGELLLETLARELDEEIGVALQGEPRFLFVQDGERVRAGRRLHAWRSFFFELAGFVGEPTAQGEILELDWFDPAGLERVLHAPYHDSFARWLAEGATMYRSAWRDDRS